MCSCPNLVHQDSHFHINRKSEISLVFLKLEKIFTAVESSQF